MGNVYNYTLQDDPPNVKGNLAAKSSLIVNQEFLLSLDYFETNRSYSELPVIKDVLLLVSQL